MPEQMTAARSGKPEFQRILRSVGCTAALALGAMHNAAMAASPASVPAPLVSVGPISTYPTPGLPFQALPITTGEVFVSINSPNGPGGIGIYTGAAPTALTQKCLVTPPAAGAGFSPTQTTLYNTNKAFAAASEAAGVALFGTVLLDHCHGAATLINQVAPQFPSVDPGTNSLVVTPDNKYAFIANEDAVQATITTQGESFPIEGSIGIVPLGAVRPKAPACAQLLVGGSTVPGTHLSPNGRTLYVTSEVAWPTTAAAGSANTILTHGGCVGKSGSTAKPNGLLTVIDVPQLEIDAAAAVKSMQAMHNTATPFLVNKTILATTTVPNTMLFPTRAIRATINAGCAPDRMIEDSKVDPTLWVSARSDNRLLAFDTDKLESETPTETLGLSLLAAVASGGQAPVGLAFFGREKFIAVANSNRYSVPSPGNVVLLSLSRAANGAPAATVVDTLDTDGIFPREINVGSDDSTLYVTNFESENFLVIPTSLK